MFEALLLFAPPFEFTLQKLLEFEALGERSHQLFAEPTGRNIETQPLYQPLGLIYSL